MNTKTVFLLLTLLGTAAGYYYIHSHPPEEMTLEQAVAARAPETPLPPFTQASTVSGAYLAGRYAQRHFDWSAARSFIDQVLHEAPDDPGLLKRSMVLAMGAGEFDKALALARKAETADKTASALTELFIAIDDFKNKNYESAARHIEKMPAGGLSDFILPLLKSWGQAALGKNATEGLDQNTIHLRHAVLINIFLKDPKNADRLLVRALNSSGMNLDDMVQIADLYVHTGNTEQARKLYQEALNLDPENAGIEDKLNKLARGETLENSVKIETAEQGVSEALFDMAQLLGQEYSDESARVFAQMAIYLNPENSKNRFLLASIAARNDRTNEAIDIYRSILPDDSHYKDARRTAAELLDENNRSEEALAELQALADQFQDVDAMIQIGDIHRMDEEFDEAIKAYTKAEEMLGGNISAEYWHLLYVRGMAYEQNKQWPQAEADLKKALEFQPSHPYLLNYLGYAWADQGIHLAQALEMIEKAVSLRPDDGYITDSLGWVYYKKGQYTEAVPYLEQAVELMPYDATINDHLGDAYWRVGRLREARFQWERAKNHAEDEAMVKTLAEKILRGLPAKEPAKAHEGPKSEPLISDSDKIKHFH